MRLLHTVDRVLVDKNADELPSYAILSHTWGAREVVYDDLIRGTAHTKSKESRSKIERACQQALTDGYLYIWIDTCCIDKSSSSELSEAINSMFAWYQGADVCYAFLASCPDSLDSPEAKTQFANNRWFTRGYTLQELIAPVEVVFLSGNWKVIATKSSISQLLSRITGIDNSILLQEAALDSVSIAKRMSWAAYRQTTKPEDIAYCLMGIFSVNMPMLYGEGGTRAFLRLQEEIMKQSDDHSLFAWLDREADPDSLHGLLAKSPANFARCRGMLPYQDWEPRPPYTMTNRGLRIDLHLTSLGDGLFVAALDCPVPPDYEQATFLAIYLREVSGAKQQYARVRADKFGSVSQRGSFETIFVRQSPRPAALDGIFPYHILQLRNLSASGDFVLHEILGPGENGMPVGSETPLMAGSTSSARSWVPGRFSFSYRMRRGPGQLTVALIFHRNNGSRLALLVGVSKDSSFNIAFDAREISPVSMRGVAAKGKDGQESNGRLFKDLQDTFKPSMEGRFQLKNHLIRLSASTLINDTRKYHLVDISIEVSTDQNNRSTRY